MPHTLITFLGKVAKDVGSGYEKAIYRFENGRKSAETNFFGIALLEHLQAEEDNKPDKFVVLGTTGSMWDVLYKIHDVRLKPEEHKKYRELGKIIEYNSDHQEQKEVPYLKELEIRLSKHLGIPCDFRLIPYGETEDEQIRILEKMKKVVSEGSHVSLDITHGLRHLPMLVILNAMYLEVAKNVTIEGIYYGAMEMRRDRTEQAPVLNLKGLLQIAKWVGALNSFKRNGDYAVFADVLKADGLSTTEPLEKAAFFERIFRVPEAAEELRTFRKTFNKETSTLRSTGRLFSNKLNAQTSWCQDEGLYERQRNLAYSFLKANKKDYVRAAIFAVEAFITHLMYDRNQTDILDYYQREVAENSFLEGELGDSNKIDDFKLLKKLRNTMAHSNPPRGEVVQLMETQEALDSKLKELMDHLFS